MYKRLQKQREENREQMFDLFQEFNKDEEEKKRIMQDVSDLVKQGNAPKIVHAFTTWLVGGGVKAGTSYGATDEIGYKAVEKRVSINDLHATILHTLGLDHEELTYRHDGRDFRLTDVGGSVVSEILS